MRRSAGHQGLGQDQQGLLPLGRQPPGPHRPHRLRAQRSHAVTLGRPAVRRRARPRQTQPHATRIVARAWLQVIWACWHTNTPYDPCAHLAEQRPTAA
jgi:hypothetical protein